MTDINKELDELIEDYSKILGDSQTPSQIRQKAYEEGKNDALKETEKRCQEIETKHRKKIEELASKQSELEQRARDAFTKGEDAALSELLRLLSLKDSKLRARLETYKKSGKPEELADRTKYSEAFLKFMSIDSAANVPSNLATQDALIAATTEGIMISYDGKNFVKTAIKASNIVTLCLYKEEIYGAFQDKNSFDVIKLSTGEKIHTDSGNIERLLVEDDCINFISEVTIAGKKERICYNITNGKTAKNYREKVLLLNDGKWATLNNCSEVFIHSLGEKTKLDSGNLCIFDIATDGEDIYCVGFTKGNKEPTEYTLYNFQTKKRTTLHDQTTKLVFLNGTPIGKNSRSIYNIENNEKILGALLMSRIGVGGMAIGEPILVCPNWIADKYLEPTNDPVENLERKLRRVAVLAAKKEREGCNVLIKSIQNKCDEIIKTKDNDLKSKLEAVERKHREELKKESEFTNEQLKIKQDYYYKKTTNLIEEKINLIDQYQKKEIKQKEELQKTKSSLETQLKEREEEIAQLKKNETLMTVLKVAVITAALAATGGIGYAVLKNIIPQSKPYTVLYSEKHKGFYVQIDDLDARVKIGGELIKSRKKEDGDYNYADSDAIDGIYKRAIQCDKEDGKITSQYKPYDALNFFATLAKKSGDPEVLEKQDLDLFPKEKRVDFKTVTGEEPAK